jgi:hypothetical protein
MKFATGFDSDQKDKVSGVLRVHANQWDRGKFECQVSMFVTKIKFDCEDKNCQIMNHFH